jgi:muconolactone delta-isomerase
MIRKSISFIGISLFALLVLSFVGCKNKQKQESERTGFELSMTNADSTEVQHLVNMFFEYAEKGNYTEAAGMLYKADAKDHYEEPQLLDNDDMEKVRNLLSSLPIQSHTIEYIKFSETYSNEVKCNAVIQPAHDKIPEIKTVFYFKPVNYLGKWKLCLVDSHDGDQPVIEGAKKDSMEKEYAKEMREKKVGSKDE